MKRHPRALASALVLATGLAALASAWTQSDAGGEAPAAQDGSSGCLHCHEGIEPMHPEADLSCVDCHGGDATTRNKLLAHVAPPAEVDVDESLAPLDRDLGWRRFRNPVDLRVVHLTCAGCHASQVESLHTSLHGTTAGHLSDGYYEVGLTPDKDSLYSVFPVGQSSEGSGEDRRFTTPPPFADHLPAGELATHYSDLARKECMQCHLYSQGRAVRGRVGFDGDYRGDGCAACHVEYALDGLSTSADRSALRTEPGHARRHEMTGAPPTSTCTSCHYGDASIGLAFRGLSQLPPGAPGGPEIPGTTDALLNRAFYLDDPATCPPDVHHERGMHCIDCHTASDLMGDGTLHGKMEHAVEISCDACHGTFTRPSNLRTARGTVLEHLRREGDRVVLTSKVTGARHDVPQVVHVLDPARPEYNAEAARAMRPEHEGLACYVCHAGWNVNFLGFHFDRNASLTQLDLVTGKRTPGRVTTQEKVFATWKSFYAGLDESGRVAPYMTGFSTMGSVTDEQGERVLDQVLPVTAEGLSGMTMIHHQTHTVRPTARSCVECHRAPGTWGLGTLNFQLARQLAFVADRRGLEVVALNRNQLTSSLPLAKVVLPDVVDIEILSDPLQGFARYLFVAEGGRGIHVLDVRDPAHPKRVAFVATVSPRGLALAGDHLYCADGAGGLRVFDVRDPAAPVRAAAIPSFEANAVHVQWPYAYVADGPGGLAIFDVRAPIAPELVSATKLHPGEATVDTSIDVAVLFQYSRPVVSEDGRTLDERRAARNLCAVLDEQHGFALVDVTEPTRPTVLFPTLGGRSESRGRGELLHRGLVLTSQVDVAEAQGGQTTFERDYVYLLSERILDNGQSRSTLQAFDVEDPGAPRRAGSVPAGYSTEMLSPGSFYNPPFLQRLLFSPGQLGVYVTDASLSNEPNALGSLPGMIGTYAIEVESFPLDRMRDAAGRLEKDVSHPASRWLNLPEIERVLAVPGDELGLFPAGDPAPELHGKLARLQLESQDADRSGSLEAGEVSPALLRSIDLDADERLSLLELGSFAEVFRPRPMETEVASPIAERAARTGPDGDLARLLDTVDPATFDRDGDGGLDRGEAERAIFSSLDIVADKSLSPDELSRYPGPRRALRFGDARARKAFREEDRDGNGVLAGREFTLADLEWEALDADGDGRVALLYDPASSDRRRTADPPAPEWPYRRGGSYPLPPVATAEGLLRGLDKNGNGELTVAELRRKPVLAALDMDGDGKVSLEELQAVVTRLDQLGVEVTHDDFEGRWDLDADGMVEASEIPLPAWLRARVLGETR